MKQKAALSNEQGCKQYFTVLERKRKKRKEREGKKGEKKKRRRKKRIGRKRIWGLRFRGCPKSLVW